MRLDPMPGKKRCEHMGQKENEGKAYAGHQPAETSSRGQDDEIRPAVSIEIPPWVKTQN